MIRINGYLDLNRFDAIFRVCRGAYSENTIRGYTADLNFFTAWCAEYNRRLIPATPETLADFIESTSESFTIATIKRRLAAIKFAHRMSDLPDPTIASSVHLALRRAARRKARRPAQAKGLTADVLTQIVEKCPDTLAGLRDATLVSVGYDTLCRSSELTAMRVDHVRETEDGNWSILIPRSKGDQAGDGRIAWLSPRSQDLLAKWLDAADIDKGPLFRGLHLARLSDTALDTSSIRRMIKRAATRAGVDPSIASTLSGHSMRVGAAQDMLTAGFDALAIMQAGGWKSPSVLLRYVENAQTQSLHERRWQLLG